MNNLYEKVDGLKGPLRFETAYRLMLQQFVDKATNGATPFKGRNGNTTRILNQQLTADLQQGFPILTGRKMPFNGIKGELLSFIRGYHALKDIQSMGCNFWDKNCKEAGADTIGPIYGYQWRRANSAIMSGEGLIKGLISDQLLGLIKGLISDPGSRRHLLMSYDPALAFAAVLPPCHVMAQWHVENAYGNDGPLLHCTVTMRSCDIFVGFPADMALYALFTELLALVTDMLPGTVCINMADCHLYEANIEQAKAYLSKDMYDLPQIAIDNNVATELYNVILNGISHSDEVNADEEAQAIVEWLERLEPQHIQLENYKANEPLLVTMVA